jgi:aminopeptidase N
MADASGVDLSQFKRWYDHAGTPHLRASGTMTRPDPPLRPHPVAVAARRPSRLRRPFHIPVAIGLIGPDGADLPLHLAGESDRADSGQTTRVLSLTVNEQEFVFEGVAAATGAVAAARFLGAGDPRPRLAR